MKYAFIEAHRGAYRVARMCRALEVSRSGYYSWRSRGEHARLFEDRELREVLWSVHLETKQCYGNRKVWKHLAETEHACGRNRIERLRREAGIQTLRRQRFLKRYTARQGTPPAPNLLEQRFEAPAPDQIWVGDGTFISTRQGWLHLFVLLDLYSRMVVGWSMAARNHTRYAIAALEMAVERRRPQPGLVHHTDQGLQYTSGTYRAKLESFGLVPSMSRKGNCHDNAVAESFFSSLKNELVHERDFKTRTEARREIFEYIEIFYNRKRLHQTLGYQTPAAFEAQQSGLY